MGNFFYRYDETAILTYETSILHFNNTYFIIKNTFYFNFLYFTNFATDLI